MILARIISLGLKQELIYKVDISPICFIDSFFICPFKGVDKGLSSMANISHLTNKGSILVIFA